VRSHLRVWIADVRQKEVQQRLAGDVLHHGSQRALRLLDDERLVQSRLVQERSQQRRRARVKMREHAVAKDGEEVRGAQQRRLAQRATQVVDVVAQAREHRLKHFVQVGRVMRGEAARAGQPKARGGPAGGVKLCQERGHLRLGGCAPKQLVGRHVELRGVDVLGLLTGGQDGADDPAGRGGQGRGGWEEWGVGVWGFGGFKGLGRLAVGGFRFWVLGFRFGVWVFGFWVADF
jgi:hypothetical protein